MSYFLCLLFWGTFHEIRDYDNVFSITFHQCTRVPDTQGCKINNFLMNQYWHRWKRPLSFCNGTKSFNVVFSTSMEVSDSLHHLADQSVGPPLPLIQQNALQWGEGYRGGGEAERGLIFFSLLRDIPCWTVANISSYFQDVLFYFASPKHIHTNTHTPTWV